MKARATKKLPKMPVYTAASIEMLEVAKKHGVTAIIGVLHGGQVSTILHGGPTLIELLGLLACVSEHATDRLRHNGQGMIEL